MHSHDQTLLAKLGFRDPDKKDARHDLACQYIAFSGALDRIAESILIPGMANWDHAFHSWGSPRFEAPLSKGEGKYKTTIGFIDLIVPFDGLYRPDGQRDENFGRLIVEVKIQPVSAGEVLRQINLYREYMGMSYRSPILWLLASPWQPSAVDAQTYKSARIHHVQLGERFDEWAEEQVAGAATGGRGEPSSLVI